VPARAHRRTAEKAAPDEDTADERVTVAVSIEARQPRHHDRVVGVTSVKDPGAQGDRVQELYERLARAKKDAGEQPVAFDKFRDLVRSQVSRLGGDGQEVAFRVSFKNGKVQLTAKIVKE
jgi:hypothetical protein